MSREYVFERTQILAVPLQEAFAFFADPRNLERLTPSWLRFRILEAPDELAAGARLRYQLRLFRVPIGWQTEIVEWNPPRGFTDLQRRGPFLLWEHSHRLTPVGDGTEIYDRVRYRLFLGPFGTVIRRLLVRGWLDRIFDYRAREMQAQLTPVPVASGARSGRVDDNA